MSQGGVSPPPPPGEGSPFPALWVWVVFGGLESPSPPVGLGGWFCPTPFGSWSWGVLCWHRGGSLKLNMVYLFSPLLVGLRTSLVAHKDSQNQMCHQQW